MNRNNLLDIFRYICAVMVVAIHTHPLYDVDIAWGYVFTNVIPRIAVPFFCCVSGYFFCKNLFSGKNCISTLKRLFVIYAMWSLIYLPINVLSMLLNGTGIADFIKKYVANFFVGGTFYHLWYLPAMIYSLIFLAIVHRLKTMKAGFVSSMIFYIIGCLGFSYYSIGSSLPFVGEFFDSAVFLKFRSIFCIALPFSYMGYLLYKLENKIKQVPNKNVLVYILIFILLFVAEIYFVRHTNLCKENTLSLMLYPLVLLVMIFIIKNPHAGYEKFGRLCRRNANFIYYAHPIVIIFFDKINMTSETLLFFMVWGITSIVGLILVCIKPLKSITEKII